MIGGTAGLGGAGREREAKIAESLGKRGPARVADRAECRRLRGEDEIFFVAR
jgi:hypothetical protein